ncbi:MAG: TPM domain-containing protein [Bacteroidia bacterium]|nr:TPM domain-containing protein [Bacteroidia bacterium]
MKSRLLFLLLFFLSHGFAAVEFPPSPNPPRLVNDFTGTLSPLEKEELENALLAFNDTTSVQISVVIISTLDGYPIEQYAFELGEKWGIGEKKTNNGALLLIALSDRKLFIATGYGLEGALPDALSKRIIENDIKPFFKEQRYFEGIKAGTGKMMDAVKGEYKDTPRRNKSKDGIPAVFIILFVLILIFVFKIFSVRRYAMLNDVPFWIAWQLLNAAAGRQKGGWSDFNKGSGPFFGGFGGGGGGSSSGGFGGFGGGSFGGGGAGGSW